MELSNRLQAVADLVTEGLVVADVGTDHAYIPIYLTKTGKNPKAFAMDINRGPLEAAKAHISEYGLSDYVETRLSDGVKQLAPGEAKSVITAGMGGGLIMKIMTEGKDVLDGAKEWILQPQSEIAKVRAFLQEIGYRVTAEDLVFEDGKYYPMMRVEKGAEASYLPEELHYGRLLLKERHPVLLSYLEWEISVKEQVLSALEHLEGERIEARQAEVCEELALARRALTYWRE